MRHPIGGMIRSSLVHRVLGLAAASGLVLAASCTADSTIGDYVAPPSTPQFESPDSGAAVDADAGLTQYCPSDKCPTGLTTCPGSRFACDVDLRTDPTNCGACGVVCPTINVDRQSFSCVDGQCVVACNAAPNATRDCDGLADNGCEVDLHTDDNCTTCGEKCLDPAKPCIERGFFNGDFGCGCYPGETYCGGFFSPCTDTDSDDLNCAGCGNACDPAGGGAPAYPNMYYGCSKAECGALKCVMGFGDCDGIRANGCEADLKKPENCGSCGEKCSAGQQCGSDPNGKVQCMCQGSETFCTTSCDGDFCTGECVDLASNTENCGVCGNSCEIFVTTSSTATGACSYGLCEQRCVQGRADCNGSPTDYCEVNTNNDPRNCGSCGHVCDAVAGQACVQGQCAVEPCDQDGGSVGTAR